MKRVYLIFAGALPIVIAGLFFGRQPTALQVTFFDIGQGDAALVRTPERQDVLVDGGPDRTILTKLGEYLPWTDRTIDLIVLSHPHADHVAGLNHVLERYRVRQVLMTGVIHTTPEYIRFLELIKEKDIPVTIAQAGQTIELSGGVSLQVLWPPESWQGREFSDLNDSSIVNKIEYGETSILFTGDTPATNEQQLLSAGTDVGANILKVAHQGSKTSSTEEFLAAVSPEVAIVSVGRNNYGHPHAEVMARLRALVSTVLTTQDEGDITYLSNGQSFVRK